jgi:hypothetical protein
MDRRLVCQPWEVEARERDEVRVCEDRLGVRRGNLRHQLQDGASRCRTAHRAAGRRIALQDGASRWSAS